ncbi:MAG: ribonuclease PH [bacterium]|nr:ribonuclease PH [bacterium]
MAKFNRPDGRRPDQLRKLIITRNYLMHPEGSCLIEMGETSIICTASVEDGAPKWIKAGEGGWVTAEYAMLPRSTDKRNNRDGFRGFVDGRSMEIRRLIGRCLRSVTDLSVLGNRRITLDCDVIQADGGTRTAAITGAYVALRDAIEKKRISNDAGESPLFDTIAAISVGIVRGEILLDLCYSEDVKADVDMNVAATGDGRLVEVQGTAEGRPFTPNELNGLVEMASAGASQLNRAVAQMFERNMDKIQID